MRFTLAWAHVLAQNISLKIATLVLLATTVTLALTSVKLALKDPLIVERGCFSKAIGTGNSQHSQAEIEAFMREALSARFNTENVANPQYLEATELGARDLEQKELSQKGMSERVLLNTVKVDGGIATVDADRLISVGRIRSAFPFPLTVQIVSTARTEANPYGLVLSKVSVVKAESKQ